jgi:carboxylesterase type B
MYPPVATSDERDALEMPANDFVSTWSMRNYSRNAGLKNGGNIWRYVYAHVFSFIKAGGHLTFCGGHVCHGSVLPLLFQIANLYNLTMTSDELKLSDKLVAYWKNFAKNSNPIIELPVTDIWPTFQSNGSLSMKFDVTSKVISNYRKEFCDFCDSIGH